MLKRLLASLQQTITLVLSPDQFRFSSNGRDAMIDTSVRVAPNGRIVGFGDAAPSDGVRVLPLFSSNGSVDERAMEILCRRGLALALGWWALRPRVVVRGAERVRVAREVLTRVLRHAGAFSVEFAD